VAHWNLKTMDPYPRLSKAQEGKKELSDVRDLADTQKPVKINAV